LSAFVASQGEDAVRFSSAWRGMGGLNVAEQERRMRLSFSGELRLGKK